MTKWEYCWVAIVREKNDDLIAVVSYYGGDQTQMRGVKSIEDAVSKLGREGWEAYVIHFGSEGTMAPIHYMKRLIR